MKNKFDNELTRKIVTIADVMKQKLGWSSLLVHTDSEDNIIGFSLGKDADWDMRVEASYEAHAASDDTKEGAH